MKNKEAVKWLTNLIEDIGKSEHGGLWHYEQALSEIKEILEKDDWNPFTYRVPTEEEKENHPDWDYVLDCKLPEDGQRILVNIKYKKAESVQLDEFYYDSEGCYLDSGYDIWTEATAWKPLPEPYRGEKDG